MQSETDRSRVRQTGDGGRAWVIAAARRFFARKGFHQTGMAELARHARVSIGQIYRLFASKSDIIIAIVQEDADRRLADLRAILSDVSAGRPVRDAIEEIAVRALHDDENEGALYFEIFAEGFRNPVAGDVIGQLCEQYRILLRELALHANPELDSSRLAGAEEMLLSCLFGLGNRCLSRPALSAEWTASLATDFICTALG